MEDFDLIDRLTQETQSETASVYSLERIMSDIPNLQPDDPMLYVLYKEYNKSHLKPDELAKVNNLINILKRKQQSIDKKNMAYMNKHQTDS